MTTQSPSQDQLLARADVFLRDAEAHFQKAAETEALFQDTERLRELPLVVRAKEYWMGQVQYWQFMYDLIVAMKIERAQREAAKAQRSAAYMSLADAEEVTGVTRRTLQRMAREGQLDAVIVGGRWRVSVDSLTARFPSIGALHR